MREKTNGRVAGKAALVTGAASGIGRAAALLFASEGARVALADLDLAAAQRAADEITSQGGDAVAFRLDVTEESDWQTVIDDLIERWGRLDILVNNAGISFAKPIEEMILEEWRRVMAVNLDGVFLGAKHAARAMREGGSIINVASASGIKAGATASAYSSSKAAVRMFSRVAALEMAEKNIRVNSVSPGGVMTQMWEGMQMWQDLKNQTGSEDAAWRAMATDVPLKRFARAEEIALAILYLASDESRYVTAADLVIDGGYTA
ncbi:MAG: SDR family NAD(P)-dependent oxidoreductase [Acidobacteriota bacterium]